MIVELHIIQSVAPANLNRDDTGAPKDCFFGGVRRARVSSQAWKRAARLAFPEFGVSTDELGVRTRLAFAEVVQRLVERGRDEKEAAAVVTKALANIGVDSKEKDKKEPLLFLGSGALDRFADRCEAHWAALLSAKKIRKGAVKDLQASDLLAAQRVVDVALFGRMVASLPEQSIQAACQVAHAISTHEMRGEFDYFTAVDDLLPAAKTGAAIIGTTEFNAACFYRYCNVDTGQLVENLDGDRDLAATALRAFLSAMVMSMPSGKQNSMAAHNPPNLVLAVSRERGQWNLANAFVDPVPQGQPPLVKESADRLCPACLFAGERSGQSPLVKESADRLLKYYAELYRAFDVNRPAGAVCLTVGLGDVKLPEEVRQAESLGDLVAEFGQV